MPESNATYLARKDIDLKELIVNTVSYPLDISKINVYSVSTPNKNKSIKIFGDMIKKFSNLIKLNPDEKIYIIWVTDYKTEIIGSNSIYLYNFDRTKIKIIEITKEILINSVSPGVLDDIYVDSLQNNSLLSIDYEQFFPVINNKSPEVAFVDETQNELYSKFTKKEIACILLKVPGSGVAWLDELINKTIK